MQIYVTALVYLHLMVTIFIYMYENFIKHPFEDYHLSRSMACVLARITTDWLQLKCWHALEAHKHLCSQILHWCVAVHGDGNSKSLDHTFPFPNLVGVVGNFNELPLFWALSGWGTQGKGSMDYTLLFAYSCMYPNPFWSTLSTLALIYLLSCASISIPTWMY